MEEEIEITGTITRQDFEDVNDFQQISFSNREEDLKGFIEIPLRFADLRDENEITIVIVNYEKDNVKKYKDSKIIFNSLLYNLDVNDEYFSYYFSAGGFVLRFTTPKEYDFGDLDRFSIVIK